MEPNNEKEQQINAESESTDQDKHTELYEQEVWDEAIRVYNEFLFSTVRLF